MTNYLGTIVLLPLLICARCGAADVSSDEIKKKIQLVALDIERLPGYEYRQKHIDTLVAIKQETDDADVKLTIDFLIGKLLSTRDRTGGANPQQLLKPHLDKMLVDYPKRKNDGRIIFLTMKSVDSYYTNDPKSERSYMLWFLADGIKQVETPDQSGVTKSMLVEMAIRSLYSLQLEATVRQGKQASDAISALSKTLEEVKIDKSVLSEYDAIKSKLEK
jgi:hypothetical protein